MKLIPAFHAEVKSWRLSQAEHALLIAFLYCLELRMRGVDFERHWDAMCGCDRAEFEGRDYGNDPERLG